MNCLVLFMLCFIFHSSDQRSTPQDDSYVAAVVEYQVNSDVNENVQNYINLIQQAKEQDADIVVFPEMTLTRGSTGMVVPIYGLLREHPIPALQPDLYDEIMAAMSNAARVNEIYVVINVQEQMDCSDASGEYCPENKVYLFNTNVVFDRTGAVIDRYRKINLFGEFTRTPALRPDLGIFPTDFGVTFGHYICFDLMFQVPAIQVVEKHKLTDVIFTTMWFSEMPYLSASQIQESYAYTMNVNFLASGANNVRVGSSGSGIFSGKAGALISVMPVEPTTRLLVSRVPKIPGQVTGTHPGHVYNDPTLSNDLVLISDPSLPSHVSRLLTNGFQEFTLVDKDVSCTFTVRLSQRDGNNSSPQYRAFVQDGTNTYARRKAGVASCSVVACLDDDIHTCAVQYGVNNDNVEIQELEIEMKTYLKRYNTTLACDDIVYFPVSFTTRNFPLDPKDYEIMDNNYIPQNLFEDPREDFVFKMTSPRKDLISFGIWGRLYSRDTKDSKEVTEKDKKDYLMIEDQIYGLTK